METPSDLARHAATESEISPTESEAEQHAAFLGYIAHEVRNPLSTAHWTAEMLARMPAEERGGARGAKLTAMALRALIRVRQLVEDHFLVERLDAGGLPMRLESLPLPELLSEVLGRGVAPGAAVDVPGSLTAVADRMLLERTLESVLAAAAADSAVVKVDGREEGDHVRLRVTGAPPGPGALEDPRKGSASDPRGRSLALSVARRAVAALGGTIAVEDGSYVIALPRAYTAAGR